jgi:hypothetical protein
MAKSGLAQHAPFSLRHLDWSQVGSLVGERYKIKNIHIRGGKILKQASYVIVWLTSIHPSGISVPNMKKVRFYYKLDRIRGICYPGRKQILLFGTKTATCVDNLSSLSLYPPLFFPLIP